MKLLEKIKQWYKNRPCDKLIGPGHSFVHFDGGEVMEPTGMFVNNKPIELKYSITIVKCTRCSYKKSVEFQHRY